MRVIIIEARSVDKRDRVGVSFYSQSTLTFDLTHDQYVVQIRYHTVVLLLPDNVVYDCVKFQDSRIPIQPNNP